MVALRPSAGRLHARFSDREDLGRQGVVARYWGNLPARPLQELFDLIETEFSLSAGLLRPDDPISKLMAPFAIQNPLTWLWAEAALEDAGSELNYCFAKRMKAFGVRREVVSVDSIGDLVELWCNPAT